MHYFFRLLKATFALLTIGLTALPVRSAEANLIEPVRAYARGLISEFNQIDPARIETLNKAANFIRDRVANGKPADLTFICTHNSRRSHFGQLWAQAAALYYNITNVTTFSGGTEATACNIRTVRAFRRAGISVVESTGGTNIVYLAKIGENHAPVKLFSKVYDTEGNPSQDFAAFLCCDQADESCPVVKGAAIRLAIHYKDPKVSDNTEAETKMYDERCRQIAREMFYLMSAVNRRS